MTTPTEHSWFPKTSCTERCVQSGLGAPEHRVLEAVRATRRITIVALLMTLLPVLAIPLPGHRHVKRLYCRLVLLCLGVRITLSGGPIRNLRSMLASIGGGSPIAGMVQQLDDTQVHARRTSSLKAPVLLAASVLLQLQG